MAFASSSSTTSKPVVGIQSSSYCNLGPESEQQKSAMLTRHSRHADSEHDDNAHPLPPLQSSFQPVYGITAAGSTNLSSSGFPSSLSTPNLSHPNRSLNDVINDEPYPSSSLSSTAEPQSPPLTDNNFNIPITSKNEDSSSHPRNHAVLSSILDLKRFHPALVLQNSGSVARDHLASERTFLAYVHTSLSLSSAGVVVVQLLTVADFVVSSSFEVPMPEARMKRFAMPLGAMTQLVALYILFLGKWFKPPFFLFFGVGLRQRVNVLGFESSSSFFFFGSLCTMTKLTVNTLPFKVCTGISWSSTLFPKTCSQSQDCPLYSSRSSLGCWLSLLFGQFG